ncbi:MAG: hypothetical protein ACLR4X_11790 [Clostridia bacterium]
MINMIIRTMNCAGENIIEKNKERIRNIKLNQQRGDISINNLYSKYNYEGFKNYLCNNVLFEDIPDSEVIRIYNCISKEQFKEWYEIRGTKGAYDLIAYYKIYK